MKAFFAALFGVVTTTVPAQAEPFARERAPSIPPPPVFQVAPPPPPPVIIPPPPSAPPFYPSDGERPAERARRAELQAEVQRVAAFDVEVRGGRELIWAGNLRVRGNGPAGTYSQTKQEAGEICPGKEQSLSFQVTRRNELRVTVSRAFRPNEADGFEVSANWTRAQESCPDGSGSRAVSFQQNVIVRPGEARELQGDGGLVVKITRQR